MYTENWLHIINHSNQNGITIFISGFLATLSIYHFLLFFQHKDKSYLYYSLYTFLLFLYVYHKAKNFFLADLSSELKPHFLFFTSALQWIFNTIYLVFAKSFIDLKKYKPKWDRALKWIVLAYFFILCILIIHAITTHQNTILNSVYAVFYIPSITLVAIMTISVVATIQNPIKYYLLIGSIIYIALSITSYYSSQHVYGSTTLFYMAIVIENVFFTLGLGAKQKKILIDKNNAQESIIKEHLINLQLQEKIKSNLDQEVQKHTLKILELTQENQLEEKRKLELEFARRTLDLKMRALQTQMNPHFLFNSLNSIKHFIISNKKEDAAYFLSKLSNLLRKILDNSRQKEISLQEELNIMQLYLEVENIRLQKQIDFNIQISNQISTSQIRIPPLVLQPFIENAIWHGLALKDGIKTIEIKIEAKANAYLIAITDNGIGREKSAILKAAKLIEKESLGISLTKERLEAYTEHLQGKVSITFKDLYRNEKAIGTVVFLLIPTK